MHLDQLPLRRWPRGLDVEAAVIDMLPDEIEARTNLAFQRDADNLDEFLGVIVELKDGTLFALRHYPHAPVAGTTIVLMRGAPGSYARAIRSLAIDPRRVSWTAPGIAREESMRGLRGGRVKQWHALKGGPGSHRAMRMRHRRLINSRIGLRKQRLRP